MYQKLLYTAITWRAVTASARLPSAAGNPDGGPDCLRIADIQILTTVLKIVEKALLGECVVLLLHM